jgi:uncharacterized MAPEG superfamily protein
MPWWTGDDTLTSLSLAHVCVLLAALLPIVCAGIAKGGMFTRPPSKGGYDNSDPRAWLARQTGYRARANAAQANSFEALPLFIAAVLIAHQTQARQPLVDGLAVGFVVVRVAYIAAYVADRNLLRTGLWTLGLLTSVALLFSSRF